MGRKVVHCLQVLTEWAEGRGCPLPCHTLREGGSRAHYLPLKLHLQANRYELEDNSKDNHHKHIKTKPQLVRIKPQVTRYKYPDQTTFTKSRQQRKHKYKNKRENTQYTQASSNNPNLMTSTFLGEAGQTRLSAPSGDQTPHTPIRMTSTKR